MDFLPGNPLATMDGPTFLVLYAIFAVFTLAVTAVAKSNIDDTDKLPTPAIPPQVDPYEIAYLRGGTNEMARSVIFSLVQKGFAGIGSDGKVIQMGEPPDLRTLPEIERRAFEWLAPEREAKEVFASGTGLTDLLKRFGEAHDHGLESRQLVASDLMKAAAKKYAGYAASVLGAVGGYKIAAALSNGHANVILAVIMTLIAVGIAFSFRKMPRMTKLGKKYVERLQTAFEDLKYKSQAPYIGASTITPVAAQAGFAGVDPLLLSVGVFGTGILAGTMFANYNDAFARAQQQAASGGSCGGSSCGSSCGSGCGGGGCGGGCGGCG